MPFRPTILLDLDGTLIDSARGIIASCRAALRQLGHDREPLIDMSALIGPPIADVMRFLLGQFDDDRIDEAVAAYRQHYGTKGMYDCQPYPGIAAAMDALTAAGGTLYLATSKRTVFAHQILAHLGLAGRLSGIYGSEPDGSVDHKPELIADILIRERIDPKGCVMVGDRRFDVSGAHANGVRAIGVLWGYGTRAELEEAGADHIIDHPTVLPPTVLDVMSRKIG